MQTRCGFLISMIKYAESDMILNCYTKENGYESFFVKGVYNKKNKKKPYLSLLNELVFEFSPQQKYGSMPQVTKIDTNEKLILNENLKIQSILFFIAEFLSILIRQEVANEVFYHQILEFKKQLYLEKYDCHLIFIFIFLRYSGALPSGGGGDYLNPEQGIFTSDLSHKDFDREVSFFWKKMIFSPSPYQEKIPSLVRKKILQSLMTYCKIHLPEFKPMQSLEVLKVIFD